VEQADVSVETASAFVNSISRPLASAPEERLHGSANGPGGLQEAQALHGQDDAGLVADPPAQLQACCPYTSALSWSPSRRRRTHVVVTLRELLLVAQLAAIRRASW